MCDKSYRIESWWMAGLSVMLMVVVACAADGGGTTATSDGVEELGRQVRGLGWVVYSARGENGTWDLFLCRPDGSENRNITNTADFEEAAPRFSADGQRLLYRRMRAGTEISHDQWGMQGQLMIAEANGSNPRALGKEGAYPWGIWSSDGKQIACLFTEGIDIIDLTTKQRVRRLARQGIYQQLFWSPDGKWFCGAANVGGEYWTIVRMDVATGVMNVVRSFQNCTPDWFADSEKLIFSSRPADQPGNNGYGWTQLWMADGDGQHQRLVYGEDGYHIYGGGTSPDGQYVVFTKCPADGGGSEKSGAAMYVMRLADAPVITGASEALRQLHGAANSGPVLEFGFGWEPHWTFVDVVGQVKGKAPDGMAGACQEGIDPTAALAGEVRDKGWLAYSSPRSGNGSWDLFVSRPDGSERRNITGTPDFEEIAPCFCRDGSRMMYRKVAKGTQVNHAQAGLLGVLVVANADGSEPEEVGRPGTFSWASWSADGMRIACLAMEGIEIYQLADRELVQRLPRKGIFAMLSWSPDEKTFCGAANFGEGSTWNVATLEAATGVLTAVQKFQSCTPDWYSDGRQVIFSNRPAVQEGYGFTQLWIADKSGKDGRFLYGDEDYHIYGGGCSPDGKYLLFTKSAKDGGGALEGTGAPICIMRYADAPTIGGASPSLRRLQGQTKDGPVLEIDWGWEPDWTYAEIRWVK